jgi:hypothetical protein
LFRNLEIYFRLAAGSWPPLRGLDAEIARIDLIVAAIDNALQAAEVEKFSLRRRVDDALSRAAVTCGNGIDEYLERESLNNHHQNLLEAEISNGERRLEELTTVITHLEFIKAAVLSRFADYKPALNA